MGHGGLENLVFNSKFPQLLEKDSGRRAWPVASEKGRGEGESLQEICFWILNFMVPGVWIGALGQGPQGEEEAGLETACLGKGCLGGIRGVGWQPAAA